KGRSCTKIFSPCPFRSKFSTAKCYGIPRLLTICLSSRLSSRIATSFRSHWQSALHNQIHGALDRNTRNSGFLVHPAVTMKLLFLIHKEVVKLGALIDFQQWSAVFFEFFFYVFLI